MKTQSPANNKKKTARKKIVIKDLKATKGGADVKGGSRAELHLDDKTGDLRLSMGRPMIEW